ncbi:MAG: galactose mutarotase [Rhizobiaceae bacterium]|nr:galactose mutarotase [Rhizobiaceae bacterium]
MGRGRGTVISGEQFGVTSDGEAVQRFPISGGGLSAKILTWGAVVQDLRLSGHEPPLVLGFVRFEDYPQHSPYFGAVPGRYANRIGNARFVIDGKTHHTDPNFLGKHSLHGGRNGFGTRNWSVALHGPDFVTLTHHSADGDMGFPGALDASCTYRLKNPGTLSIELNATCSEPTICNLTNHSYFNLDDGGTGDTLDHQLQIGAAAYLPVDDELIPTGVVQPVDGTPFDFTRARAIRHKNGGAQFVYDHNFCLASTHGRMRRAATARGAISGVEMEMWTTEPGVQFYGGHKIPEIAGLGGREYGPYSGFCLEAQVWPDAPNRPYFPSALLRPGETYHHVTEYRFRIGA